MHPTAPAPTVKSALILDATRPATAAEAEARAARAFKAHHEDTASRAAEAAWNDGPLPALDAYVFEQAEEFRALGTTAARLIADELAALGNKIRMTGARTPAEYRARVATLDADARSQWEAIGYEEGLAAGRGQAEMGTSFGHMA